MPINLPEEIVNLMDLKQTLFFFVHQNFRVYGSGKTGTIIVLVPERTVPELVPHIKKLYKGKLGLNIGPNTWWNRIRLYFRGYEKL